MVEKTSTALDKEEIEMKDWEALRSECMSCQNCGQAETRTNVVFGEGNQEGEVLI